ncbi:MAG: helix-turn-helix transcriptional regulator [Ruminococcus sp.]
MIGKRIRFIRKKRNMTMKFLGIAAGLPENSADIRIAQYESETRTPKTDLLRKIADVLEVSPNALSVPELDSIAGVMHTLFILEDLYSFRFTLDDCTSDRLKKAINEWQGEYERYSKGEIGKEQYDNWRYNYI